MTIEFFELPLGTPSTNTTGTGNGYCTVNDVQAMNWARPIGVGSNPGTNQVQIYIQMTAAEMNAILINKGYCVPVNSASSPEAGALLNMVNAKGALAMMEEASPNSPNLDRVLAAWTAAKMMLADAKFVMDVAQDTDRAEARGPWVTYTPGNQVYDPIFGHRWGETSAQNPYFRRGQMF